jgi:hypothetical protein
MNNKYNYEYPKEKEQKDKQYNGENKKNERTNNIMVKTKRTKGQTI